MNKKQAIFRLFVCLVVLYLGIYSVWLMRWGSLGPGWYGYVPWDEFLIQSMRLFLVGFARLVILIALVGGGIIGVVMVDDYLGLSPNHSTTKEKEP